MPRSELQSTVLAGTFVNFLPVQVVKISIKQEHKKQKILSNIGKVGWKIWRTGAANMFKINVKQETCQVIKQNNEVTNDSD